MTDKELAKEYVSNKADNGNFDLEQFGKAYFSERSMELAFLAGIKAAGRPKWHKVADGDLPLVNSTVLNEDCDKVEYIGEGKWITYSEYYEENVEIEPPIAWCKKPEYMEE